MSYLSTLEMSFALIIRRYTNVLFTLLYLLYALAVLSTTQYRHTTRGDSIEKDTQQRPVTSSAIVCVFKFSTKSNTTTVKQQN